MFTDKDSVLLNYTVTSMSETSAQHLLMLQSYTGKNHESAIKGLKRGHQLASLHVQLILFVIQIHHK